MGIPKEDIRNMVKTNPEKVLGLKSLPHLSVFYEDEQGPKKNIIGCE